MRGGRCPSLRRFDPDQVHRVDRSIYAKSQPPCRDTPWNGLKVGDLMA